VKPTQVELPPLDAYSEDLLLAASSAPPINPILGAGPGLTPKTKSKALPSKPLGSSSTDGYAATNRRFIVVMLVATVVTL
jgi:hypothetical protein